MSTNLGDLLRAQGLKASEPSPTAADPTPPAPEGPAFGAKVVLRATRKGRGGKVVTEVQGVASGHEQVALQLRQRLGVGARVEADLVVVQGDQRDRLQDWLARQGVRQVVRG